MTKKFDETTPLRKPRATKAEMDLRRRTAQRGAHTMLPGLIQERQRMFDERMRAINTTPVSLDDSRICNASMRDTTYRTGDGEVIQQPRPGSLHAFTLPSRGFST